MAKDPNLNPVAPGDSTTSAPAGKAAPAGTKKPLYAQRTIIHEDKIIKADGKPLPDGIPEDSLKLLLQNGDVAETKPPERQPITKAEEKKDATPPEKPV